MPLALDLELALAVHRLQFRSHAVHQPQPDILDRGSDGATDTVGLGGAVSQDDRAVDTEEWPPHGSGQIGGGPKLGDYLDNILGGQELRKLIMEVGSQGASQAFGELNQYVTDKSIAYDYVGPVGEEVHALHIADKI